MEFAAMSDSAKLHIDDDWKSQAQREKAKLSEQLDSADADRDADAGMGPGGPPDFRALVNLIAMQAMIGLGAFRDASGHIPPNFELAKFHIDLLDVLEQKTRGNLTEQEQRLIDTSLYQLRMSFVQLTTGAPAGPGTPPLGPGGV